jgi:hypothetical protein
MPSVNQGRRYRNEPLVFGLRSRMRVLGNLAAVEALMCRLSSCRMAEMHLTSRMAGEGQTNASGFCEEFLRESLYASILLVSAWMVT